MHAVSTLSLLREQRAWCVYRYQSRDILGTRANATAGVELLVTRALYFVGQRYNGKILIPKSRRSVNRVGQTAFCSELLCNLYDPARLDIGKKLSTSVLPADIYRSIYKSDDWMDITKIYSDYLQNCSSQGLLDRWIESEELYAKAFEREALVAAQQAAGEVTVAQALQAVNDVKSSSRKDRFGTESLIRKRESINGRLAKTAAEGEHDHDKMRQLNRPGNPGGSIT